MRILLTGGCGSIGSNTVRRIVRNTAHTVVILDSLTYAGSRDSLRDLADKTRHLRVDGDICDAQLLRGVPKQQDPDVVMHLAAESHVDQSIDAPAAFIPTNLIGTYTLLKTARSQWE